MSTPDEGVANLGEELLGDRLNGINATDFADAKANFQAVEELADGLGPIFNERSCGACHSNGATGGAGEQIERRYGRFVNGGFDGLPGSGGSLRQLFTVATFNNGAQLCKVPLEVEPAAATVHNVGRLATPLFGLGLVDAMPDSFFDGLAAAEPAAIRGVVNRSAVLIPLPNDPNGAIGAMRVNRFGWKAAVPTLAQFSADAYVNEMGITTQSCFKGTSITAFSTESAPNGIASPAGCDDLAPLQSTADVTALGIHANTDDIVGSCAGGLTELQDDLDNFFKFMTFLAPPPRDFSDQISITRGQPIFTQVGCAGCHTTQTFVTPNPTVNGVPGGFSFNPFSDFLAHDMGALGDQIGLNQGDSVAASRRMRTAPLWGIRFRNHLLHDGRTSDIQTAILAHAGQAQASRNAFNALSAANKHNVVQFIRSL